MPGMVLTRERIMRGRASERADCTGAGRRGLGMLLTGRNEGGRDVGRVACFSTGSGSGAGSLTGLDMEAGGGTELGRSGGFACAPGA